MKKFMFSVLATLLGASAAFAESITVLGIDTTMGTPDIVATLEGRGFSCADTDSKLVCTLGTDQSEGKVTITEDYIEYLCGTFNGCTYSPFDVVGVLQNEYSEIQFMPFRETPNAEESSVKLYNEGFCGLGLGGTRVCAYECFDPARGRISNVFIKLYRTKSAVGGLSLN